MGRQIDDSLRYTAPEVVAAMALAEAHANGSPKRRRRLKVVAWMVLLGFALAFASQLYMIFGG